MRRNHIALIEQWQPIQGRSHEAFDFLSLLNDLAAEDRHRAIHSTVAGMHGFSPDIRTVKDCSLRLPFAVNEAFFEGPVKVGRPFLYVPIVPMGPHPQITATIDLRLAIVLERRAETESIMFTLRGMENAVVLVLRSFSRLFS